MHVSVCSTGEWTPRVRNRGSIIPRLATVPRHRELYFIRMLLLHVRAPRCFEDLRTVNGVVYVTFQEACVAAGLLRDDNEHRNAMQEAAINCFGPNLRQLLAYQVR